MNTLCALKKNPIDGIQLSKKNNMPIADKSLFTKHTPSPWSLEIKYTCTI